MAHSCECKLDQKESSLYCFLFLQVLECFTSLGALLTYVRSLIREGFPHSEILGYNGCLAPYRGVSPPYCVLHRFLEPRHPPYALIIPVRNNDNHNVSFVYFYCAILHCTCIVRSTSEKTPLYWDTKLRERNDAFCPYSTITHLS